MARKQTKAEQVRQKRWPEIQKRIEQEESYSAIAKDIGVSPATMLKWLMEEGYKYRTKGRYPRAMRGRVKEMVERGWEVEDVAEFLKIDKKLAVRWYAEDLPAPKDKSAKKKNPAPRKHQISVQAQRLIGDPRVPRHKRGRKWEDNQKRFVVDLIRKRFSVIEIYRIMGASKARQSKIWKEIMGRRRTPPNFPSEEGPALPTRRIGESRRQQQRRGRKQLAADRHRAAKQRREARRKAIEGRRKSAAGELPPAPAEPPPPEPGLPAVVPPAPPETRAFVEPEITPPSRETPLPRPPKRKKRPKGKGKKRKKRRGY